jgi:hypothetical protein
MSRRRALREEAITNSLHLAPYQKLPRDFRHFHLPDMSTYLHLKTLPKLPRFNV